MGFGICDMSMREEITEMRCEMKKPSALLDGFFMRSWNRGSSLNFLRIQGRIVQDADRRFQLWVVFE